MCPTEETPAEEVEEEVAKAIAAEVTAEVETAETNAEAVEEDQAFEGVDNAEDIPKGKEKQYGI